MSAAETASRLKETVDQARSWLLGLDEATVRNRPTADRWSIAEVIGHLIDSASNNHQRFIRAQDVDELKFPKYEQNSWVARNNYQERDWSELVQLWYLYNLHLAHVMKHIPEDELETPCSITSYEPCTLRFLVTDYLDHLNHHLAKIRKRMA